MKFLCISAATEENQHESNSSKLRVWYNSIRRGLKRNKEPRVTISEPIRIETLTQSDLIQINGVIEVKPSVDDNELCRVNSADASTETKDDAFGNIEAATESNCAKETTTHIIVTAETNVPKTPDETTEQIVSYVWFWGSISRKEAEGLLRGKKDGSFLVRASSDKRFLYSLSFRSNGKTMHTRIEHSNGMFFFFSNESNSNRSNDGSPTLGGLISVAMNQNNADSIFFYSRGLRSESSLHTVSLNQPLSRYQYLLDYQYESNENKSLQYMCKFVVHHSPIARFKLEQQLQSLPVEIRTFADNAFYFPRKATVLN